MKITDEFKEWLDSPEIEAKLDAYVKNLNCEEKLKEKQIQRFHSLTSSQRDTFIKNVIEKYNSNEYKERWYRMGIIPPEDLYSLIFDYGEQYGIPLESDNPFTNGKYLIDNKWVTEMMIGQGTVVNVWEKDGSEKPTDECTKMCMKIGDEYIPVY